MKIIKSVKDLTAVISVIKQQQLKIGFVPTMGALHEGHLSLVRQSKELADVTIVSIFVNKEQFNDDNDFNKYPRDLESDSNKLLPEGVDYIFAPEKSDMDQVNGISDFPFEHFDLHMEGVYRPGHFKGVANIVYKFFQLIKPDFAFFGMKDYQQCVLIQNLIQHYNFNINLVKSETVRGSGGLALSSRNQLIPDDKSQASTILIEILNKLQHQLPVIKDQNDLQNWVKSELQHNQEFKLEYLEIVEDGSIQPCLKFDDQDKLRACICGYLGGVRLIDNMLLN